MGALGRARRRRHPGDAEPGPRARERRGRRRRRGSAPTSASSSSASPRRDPSGHHLRGRPRATLRFRAYRRNRACVQRECAGSAKGKVAPARMRIGVAKEIKPDEYRVALTPAGARELVQRGHEVLVEAGAGEGSAFPDAAYEAVGRAIVLGRRGLGRRRAPAQGQGADPGRVRPAARGARPLHVPPPRRRRGADARARRERDHGGRLRDGGDRATARCRCSRR